MPKLINHRGFLFIFWLIQLLCIKAFCQNNVNKSDIYKVDFYGANKIEFDINSKSLDSSKLVALDERFKISNLFRGRKRESKSLQSTYRKSLALKVNHEIDSMKRSFIFRFDSIESSSNDPLVVKKKSDSLKQVYESALSRRISFLKRNGVRLPKRAGRLSDKALLATGKFPQLSTSRIPGAGDLSGNLPISNIGRSDESLPKLDVTDASLSSIQNSYINVPQLGELKNRELPGELSNARNVMGDVSSQAKEVGGLAKDAERLKGEGINSDEANELIDGAIKNAKPLEGVSNQLSEVEKLDQLKQLDMAKFKDAQLARDQLASKITTNQVLQNEEAVKVYMEKMRKRKRKFNQISDMRYIPKIKPNEMKGKPLGERVVPGLLFQIFDSGQTRDSKKIVSWFLAPELLYRISGKLSAGIGGVYRIQYSVAPKVFWDRPLYGYKLIGQLKIWKDVHLRAEWENLSFYSPPTLLEDRQRIWRNNWLAGIGRVQPITARLSGYFWAFYNVTRDPDDIFRNRVILKTGLQFTIANNHKKLIKHVGEKMKLQREYLKQQMKNEIK